MSNSSLRALYIVVNTGFAEQIVEIIRANGSSGATVINARGVDSAHKEIMGISNDAEKEMILTITTIDIAVKIMNAVKQYAGFRSEAQGICFSLPVTKTVGINIPTGEQAQ